MDGHATREDSGWTALRMLRAARVIHPFPVGLNVATTAALASIAVDGVPAAADLARLTVAMFCVQAAIGASNDYCDRDLDAIAKPYKPIVRGLVKPNVALLLAALLALVAAALTAAFGPLSLAVGACGLLAGLAYNFRLKRSVLSPLPFMVALPALPFWVWVSLDSFANELWWLLPFGPLVGLSVHLSNTVPDLEQDRPAGVRGLAHVLGTERTLAIAWGSFSAALILAVALGFHLDYDWPLFLLGAGAAAVLLVVAIGAYALRRSQGALQLGFGLMGSATAVLAGAWLAFGGLG